MPNRAGRVAAWADWLRVPRLRLRLASLILLAVIPASCLALYAYLERSRHDISEALDDLQVTAGAVADRYALLVANTRNLLADIALFVAEYDRAPGGCGWFLSGLKERHLKYANLAATDKSGVILCIAVPFEDPAVFPGQAWLRRALQSRGFAFGDIMADPVTGTRAIGASMPITNRTGGLIGAAFASLDPGHFTLPATLLPRAGLSVLVLNSQGAIVARHPDHAKWVGRSLPEAEVARAVLAGRREGTAEALDVDGVPRFWAFAPVGAVEGGDALRVAVGVRSAAVLGPARQALARSLLALVLVALLALAGAALWAERFVVRPVHALTDTAATAWVQTFEAVADGVCLLDSQSRIVVCNSAMSAMFGRRADEMLGRHCWEVVHGTNEPIPECPVVRMKETLRRESVALQIADRSYEITLDPFLGEGGEFTGAVHIVRDATARRQAEEALRSQREHLERLHEAIRSALASPDLQTMLQAMADRLVEVLGADACYINLWDQARQQPTLGATAGVDPPAVLWGPIEPGTVTLTGSVLAAGHAIAVEDLSDTPFVSPRLVSAVAHRSAIGVPLIAGDEKLGGLSMFFRKRQSFTRDQIARAEQAGAILALALQRALLLDQARGQAAELERRVEERTAALLEANADLEAFGYSVAHDLRAPLRAMRGFGQALREDYSEPLDEEGRDYLRRIVAGAEEMDRLIEDLLAYSLLGRLEMHLNPVSLTDVVGGALAMLQEDVSRQDAVVRLEEPFYTVMGHRPVLVQVVWNLLSNALKFIPAGVIPRVRIWAEARDGLVRLWVEDNGIGIAPEHHARIFRVFERLHGSEDYPGTGAGLAIVRRGVERMGGRVGVESSPGQGSRFWIEMPVVDLSSSREPADVRRAYDLGANSYLVKPMTPDAL